ncbi:winged helix-turn-helix transcriptional regulator [Lentzea sp.]|uniref:winged helix-turn-helix transcriptional regulator n=1 Tax=Lentzea sp. TaxID=56099 RepID=UPI002B58CF7C|nr:winged helix-turn-helix transcriptional regulator [Lentzea sp.]HUQ56480.1 winged helix-turn-helix transcriptional regulator [Lentzea sp.]
MRHGAAVRTSTSSQPATSSDARHRALAPRRKLREFEADGLVAHRPRRVPSRVEYGLTALGRSLSPVVEQLKAWGEYYRSSARESRASALPS